MDDDPALTGGIKSLDKGLQLLQCLRDQPTLSVNQAAKLLGSAPSTAHRLLATLKARGFVVQDDTTRRYRAGGALLDVAFDALRNLDVRRAARPHLELLAQEVRQTVNLIVLEETSIRYVDVVESPERLRISNRIGEARPAHCTASGKALLASLSPQQFDRLYPSEELASLTPRSITRKAELVEELARVRERGYATSLEESMEGATAVAVAIHDPMDNVIAALAVASPSSRMDEARVAAIALAAHRSVQAIRADLRSAGR